MSVAALWKLRLDTILCGWEDVKFRRLTFDSTSILQLATYQQTSSQQINVSSLHTVTAVWKEKVVTSLNSSEATGPDCLPENPQGACPGHGSSPAPPWYNRTGWLGVKHQLTYLPALPSLYRRSLDTGETPSDWREATVSPVYKKGEWYDTVKWAGLA